MKESRISALLPRSLACTGFAGRMAALGSTADVQVIYTKNGKADAPPESGTSDCNPYIPGAAKPGVKRKNNDLTPRAITVRGVFVF
jgi:hypothetical protein